MTSIRKIRKGRKMRRIRATADMSIWKTRRGSLRVFFAGGEILRYHVRSSWL